jgi:hypothetical protein
MVAASAWLRPAAFVACGAEEAAVEEEVLAGGRVGAAAG